MTTKKQLPEQNEEPKERAQNDQEIAKISNQDHEIHHAAKFKNVPDFVILLAKHQTGSSNRDVIYQWIDENRGKKLDISY